MCGRMKLVSICHLSVLIALVSLSCSNAQKPSKPISPEEEARYVALNATEEDLLPNPDLVKKITQMIVAVRKEYGQDMGFQMQLAMKVTNPGDWHLGRVRVSNYSPDLKKKIDKSEYAPLKEVKVSKTNKKEADLIFTKPYHPIRLSKRLKKEFGAEAQEIWYDPKKIPNTKYITYESYETGSVLFTDEAEKHSTWIFIMDEATGKAKSHGMMGGE